MVELDPRRRRQVSEIARAAAHRDPPRLEPGQSVVGGHDRLKHCDRSAALGHLQRLTTPNPAQVDAEVLAKLAYTDPIHDAQNVAQLRQTIRPGPRRGVVRGSKPRRSRSPVATPPATHEPLPR